MSKKKKKHWKKLKTDVNLLNDLHLSTNNFGFQLPVEKILTDKELLIKSLNVDKVTIEEFDIMHNLIKEKYADKNLDLLTLSTLFKKEFDFIITPQEICVYSDVTLDDDIKEKKIMLNNLGYNVEYD